MPASITHREALDFSAVTTQGASWIASLLTCDAIRSRSHRNGSSFSNAPITAASAMIEPNIYLKTLKASGSERQARAHADALAQALADKPDIASKPDIADVKLSIAETKSDTCRSHNPTRCTLFTREGLGQRRKQQRRRPVT